ncbi:MULTISPECIES: hypothetical protein [Mycobacterium]|uniref:DUF695 domain-containing protein n=3 Tax=Mycobacterium TaxID=1763 RepID=A0AAW5SD46_MYCBC|nr:MULTISPECIES: hypothetical protein [Mycobacterium]MBZ4632018.1 hypothetical protein [Mycobacterium avium subsp. hominissuis]MCV6992821.1 hypothetical protein [Mycobacterium bouchedurhonense]MCV6993304.1 hypothetical protein [Mycobacterium timonense]MDV3306483.1 hypothetical protein [Mycobacterium avium subsp. hominissuis]ORA44484.1 hypothetical protein BST19_21315 [Mycobacterium bouchedurhonense]
MSDDERITAAEAFLAEIQHAALVAEAEDLAAGMRHLSVVTGDLESEDDVRRLEQLTTAAWRGRDGARLTRSGGGNDYVTFYVDGPTADRFVEDLARLAETLNPGWWRIIDSPHPF